MGQQQSNSDNLLLHQCSCSFKKFPADISVNAYPECERILEHDQQLAKLLAGVNIVAFLTRRTAKVPVSFGATLSNSLCVTDTIIVIINVRKHEQIDILSTFI